MKKRNKGLLQLLMASMFFIASWYCLLWVFSSSSLAFQACGGEYSLFHGAFRCKQPYIAFILWVVFGAISIYLFIKGKRDIKSAKLLQNT